MRRGAADHPEDIRRLRAVDENHVARGRSDERGSGLEDEDGVLVALGVEGHDSAENALNGRNHGLRFLNVCVRPRISALINSDFRIALRIFQ
jgi:hypothetical protein